MYDNYEFAGPGKIVFGCGRRGEAGTWARTVGTRAFVVTGSRQLEAAGVYRQLADALVAAGVECLHVGRAGREPLVEDVDQLAAVVRSHGPRDGDFVLAIGGGSAIDLGKAMAAMAAQRDAATVRDYLEGAGRSRVLEPRPLPSMVMPTTGGTGSEATKNAVISSRNPAFKKSLRHEALLPRVALVDPELTLSLPAAITAHTGMDAITQLIESYLSRRATLFTRQLAAAALPGALAALPDAVRQRDCRAARTTMSHAALVSGMALANSGLGLAHGVAAALGVVANVPHGLACAVMLPVALCVNRSACEQDLAALWRATCLQGEDLAHDTAAQAADAFVSRIDALCNDLGVPTRLSELGVDRRQIPALVQYSHGNSRSGNPRDVTDDELTRLLEERL